MGMVVEVAMSTGLWREPLASGNFSIHVDGPVKVKKIIGKATSYDSIKGIVITFNEKY